MLPKTGTTFSHKTVCIKFVTILIGQAVGTGQSVFERNGVRINTPFL